MTKIRVRLLLWILLSVLALVPALQLSVSPGSGAGAHATVKHHDARLARHAAAADGRVSVPPPLAPSGHIGTVTAEEPVALLTPPPFVPPRI